MNKRKIKTSGTEKAAQFLLVMGEERAAEILRRLSSEEVQKIGMEMTRMKQLSTDEVSNVLTSFLQECEANELITVSSDEYTRKVLVQALGEDAADNLLERILLGGNTKGLDALRWMEPQLISGIIQNEHPQIQAIVLSYLPPDLAGDVIAHLPKEQTVEIVIRMGEMESVDPKALQELNRSLERQVQGVVTKQGSSMGGVKNVADIFNTLERSYEDSLMEKIKERIPDMATRIQELMFVFEDLVKIPDKDFQLVLREVATDKLALAMKGADQSLMEKVKRNMSSRAAEIFTDDMETLGPVKISDVEAAQKEILATVKQLGDSGQIVLQEDDASMIG